jgi:hypothetical protein
MRGMRVQQRFGSSTLQRLDRFEGDREFVELGAFLELVFFFLPSEDPAALLVDEDRIRDDGSTTLMACSASTPSMWRRAQRAQTSL